MAYEDSRGDRPMFKGNWSCGQCSAAITELPFEPDPARLSQLTCRDCHKKGRSERPRTARTDRPMFQGNWSCGDCGSPISELPFQPDPARVSELTCLDCHKKKREARF